MQPHLPRIGSHEFAGSIVSLGPSVSPTLGLKPGTLVGVPGRAYRPCGTCRECTENGDDPEGYGVWCPKAGNNGITRDGGFQDEVVVDSRQVAPVPEPLTAVETAPLMCAGLTVWAALLRVPGVEAREGGGRGKKVVISGAGGGLGHLGVQFAVRLGFEEVVAVDAAEGPLELVREVVRGLGEQGKRRVRVVDARKEDAGAVLNRIGGEVEEGLEGERGCDAVLILPESQRALDYGVSLLKNHGTCVVVSFPKEGFHVSARDLVFRDIKVIGSLVGRNTQLREMLAFAAKHGVRASVKTFPLEGLNQLVEEYHKGSGGKLVVDMAMKA